MKTMAKEVGFKKTLNFGEVDCNGTGRKVNLVEIKVELKETDSGLVLSICGNIWNRIHTDIISGGQNIDEIASLFPYNKKVKRIYEIWERWHLNDLRPGCVHQKTGNYSLPEISNQYCDICKYKYGTAWLFEEIPAEVIAEIKSW